MKRHEQLLQEYVEGQMRIQDYLVDLLCLVDATSVDEIFHLIPYSLRDDLIEIVGFYTPQDAIAGKGYSTPTSLQIEVARNWLKNHGESWANTDRVSVGVGSRVETSLDRWRVVVPFYLHVHRRTRMIKARCRSPYNYFIWGVTIENISGRALDSKRTLYGPHDSPEVQNLEISPKRTHIFSGEANWTTDGMEAFWRMHDDFEITYVYSVLIKLKPLEYVELKFTGEGAEGALVDECREISRSLRVVVPD